MTAELVPTGIRPFSVHVLRPSDYIETRLVVRRGSGGLALPASIDTRVEHPLLQTEPAPHVLGLGLTTNREFSESIDISSFQYAVQLGASPVSIGTRNTETIQLFLEDSIGVDLSISWSRETSTYYITAGQDCHWWTWTGNNPSTKGGINHSFGTSLAADRSIAVAVGDYRSHISSDQNPSGYLIFGFHANPQQV